MQLIRRDTILAMVTAVVVAGATTSFADDARVNRLFRSSDGLYELRLLEGGAWDPAAKNYRPERWGLFVVASGDLKYQITGPRISTQSVYFAADGHAVVAVDDYSPADWSLHAQVLSFYIEAGPTKSYLLGDLLSERLCVSSSASHFDWLVGPPKVDGVLVSLTTYELTTYTFNMTSGDLISRVVDSRLSDGALYVYGPVTRIGHNLYRVQVVCPLSATTRCHDEIEFKCRKSDAPRLISDFSNPWGTHRFERGDYNALIIRDGKCVASERLLVNTCRCGDEPQ